MFVLNCRNAYLFERLISIFVVRLLICSDAGCLFVRFPSHGKAHSLYSEFSFTTLQIFFTNEIGFLSIFIF